MGNIIATIDVNLRNTYFPKCSKSMGSFKLFSKGKKRKELGQKALSIPFLSKILANFDVVWWMLYFLLFTPNQMLFYLFSITKLLKDIQEYIENTDTVKK